MNVTINNEQKQIAATTVEQLCQELSLPQRGVAIAINGRIITKSSWADTTISDGDSITIIKAAFGG